MWSIYILETKKKIAEYVVYTLSFISKKYLNKSQLLDKTHQFIPIHFSILFWAIAIGWFL